MTFYMVTLNGHPIAKALLKPEAEAMAERWQGSHGGYRGGSGLLKIKDRRDHVEVKLDEQMNREFNERYKTLKSGDHQKVVFEQRVEDGQFADPAMKG